MKKLPPLDPPQKLLIKKRFFPIATGRVFYYHYNMKPVRKIVTAVMVLALLLPFAFADAGNTHFTLTLRMFAGKQAVTDLQKQDFQLLINDQQRDILEVVQKNASLQQKPEFLGRNFILAFHLTDYSNQVQGAMAHFVTEILIPGDSLILLTPLKIYRINVSTNKEKMITDIEELVKNDCSASRKKLHAAQKNLEIQMNRMTQLFRGEIRDPGLATSYKMIGTFLSTFPQGFLNFRNQFLFPDLKNYQKVLGFLGDREGERWWIHFQQCDSYGMMAKAQLLAKKIDDYCNLYELARQSFQNNLQQLQKMFQLADSFPSQQLLHTFVNGNIRYSSLLWEHRKSKGKVSGAEIIAHLGGIMAQISRDSGGKTIHTTQLEKGMRDILNYRDQYYQIIYPFDSKTTGEKISITTTSPKNQKLKLIHKKHYTAEEIQTMVQYLAQKKVRLKDFSLNNSKIKFSIDSVTQNKNKEEAFGLVKVRIELFDLAGKQAYRTGNTLRSSQQNISVTIPLPPQHKGKFRLRITACDLMANQLTTFERQIVLK